jgi:hypothetical protein
MHFIRGSIRVDALYANAHGSGMQHFPGERLTSVPRTPLYHPLLIRIGLQTLTLFE